jgi:hypothetical protein
MQYLESENAELLRQVELMAQDAAEAGRVEYRCVCVCRHVRRCGYGFRGVYMSCVRVSVCTCVCVCECGCGCGLYAI